MAHNISMSIELIRIIDWFARRRKKIPIRDTPTTLFKTISKINPFLKSWLISFDFPLRKP
jgi:hypothetical protein